MNIKSKIKELESLRKEVPNQAELIAKKWKNEILDYVRIKQLYEKGINGEGEKLKEYTNYTKAEKFLKNQPTDRTTLLDTGSFFAFFKLKFIDDDTIDIFSTDSKAPKLIEKYKKSIFQLTVKNNEIVNEDIFLKNLIKWLLNTKTFTQI